MTDFMARIAAERARLAADDLEGEREAVSPLPGSPAYWDLELARPLKGALWMDQSTAERIATALEQIALELVARPLAPPVGYIMDSPAAPVSVPPTGPQGQQQLPNPANCRLHGTPFRNGKFGWYCATKQPDGTWCKEKPYSVMPQQLP